MSDTADVVVIGGGVMGCGIAYHLARAGRDVVLLERGELNREASGANAGTIHLQIRQHENRGRGRRWLIEQSAAEWRTLERELATEIGLRLHGGLMLAETEAEVDRLREKIKLDAELGLEPALLADTELHALEPALAETVAAAVYSPHEGSANPLLVTHAFAQRARAAGATLCTHAAATAIESRDRGGFRVQTQDGAIVEAATVVCAAGAWTADVCRLVGLDVHVWGYALGVSVTEKLPPTLRHVVQHIGRKLTVKQTSNGTFLLGGGWLGADAPARPNEARIESIVGNAWEALSVLPVLAEARLLRSWAGTIAVTADALPVLGEHPAVPGFVVAVVPVGSAGYTVGPVVARLVADAIASGTWPVELAEYAPARRALNSRPGAGNVVDCLQPTERLRKRGATS